jgi:hypothetical protein
MVGIRIDPGGRPLGFVIAALPDQELLLAARHEAELAGGARAVADLHAELVEPGHPVVERGQAGQVHLVQRQRGQPSEPGRQPGQVAVLDQAERVALIDAVIEQQRQRVLDRIDLADALAAGELVERLDRVTEFIDLALQDFQLDIAVIAPAQLEQRFVAMIEPLAGSRRIETDSLCNCSHLRLSRRFADHFVSIRRAPSQSSRDKAHSSKARTS